MELNNATTLSTTTNGNDDIQTHLLLAAFLLVPLVVVCLAILCPIYILKFFNRNRAAEFRLLNESEDDENIFGFEDATSDSRSTRN